jgi:GT2 family glycosyltransferase
MNKDISVIIVNWNTRDLLLKCVESVYETIKTLTMEIFVVDNGSSDSLYIFVLLLIGILGIITP